MPEISEHCVCGAWLKAIRLANGYPKKEVSNLLVNIEGLDNGFPVEDINIRAAFDAALVANGNFTVSTVANTIFPASLWRRDSPRSALYSRYMRLWPRIQQVSQNKRGTYFQRLIAYPKPSESALNQLDFVISAFRSGTHRRSALQCAILAPAIDLNATPYQGFPCMQQIAFVPEGSTGLRVTALYPMQYLWARAYGNYIGLINLGRFMASEMGLHLKAITCIALVAKIDKPKLARSFLEADHATHEIR